MFAFTIAPMNSTMSCGSTNLDLAVISVNLNHKYRTYWEGLNRGEISKLENSAESTLSVLFLKYLQLHLCRLFGTNCSIVPNPISYLMHMRNGHLFGERSYTWKSGINVKETVNYMKKPFSTHNLHFVGSWCGDIQNQPDRVAGDINSVKDFIDQLP